MPFRLRIAVATGARIALIGPGLLGALVLLSGLVAAVAAQDESGVPPEPDPSVRVLYRRPAAVPFPSENPYSRSKAELGRRLFFDPQLSGDDSLSCASCHSPALGFEDGRPLGRGVASQPGPRHVPTLWNVAWGERFFWDGRAPNLEAQASEPITNPVEMAQDLAALLDELAAEPEYVKRFAAAFPDRPAITPENIAAAIATYERTLVSPPTPFDRWIAGDDEAIDESARRGFALFTGKANCAACHAGWNFTDQAFHDIGLPGQDRGRGAVLGIDLLSHAFKTPTLREIGRRAPYMHDGSLPDLEAVLDHYETGIVQRPSLSPDLQPISLTPAERSDLLAFLATLDSKAPSLPTIAPAVTVAKRAGTVGAPQDFAEVTQRSKRFSRDHVSLRKDGLLLVRNEDERMHNLRIFDPKLDFNSGLQHPGESVAVRFPQTGSYRVFCGIHPKMELRVEVE